MTKLLLTGASGHLGRATLDALLASGKVSATDLIAVTRNAESLADYAATGVDVREGDFSKPETLGAAFEGAERVAIISADVPVGRFDLHKAAIDAAKAADADRLLYTSLPRIEGVPVTFGGDHFETEDAIVASGLDYSILRNNWYAENLFVSLKPAFASGQWFTSAGDGKLPYLPRAQFGKALAAALVDDEAGKKIYTITGSEALTISEVAAIANQELGTNVAVVNVSDAELAEGMKQAGLPDPVVPFLVSMDTNIRNGGLDIVTGDVKALTGEEPLALRQFIADNRDAFLN